MLEVLIVELLCLDLSKTVPFTQTKSLNKLLDMESFFLGNFIDTGGCSLLTNVPRGSTSRFEVEAKARA